MRAAKKTPAADVVAKRGAADAAIKQWIDDGKGYRGPCSIKKTCPVMRMALAAETRRGPGLGTVTLMSIGPKAEISHRIVYRRSARDNGLVINHCPFCGERVHEARP